MKRIITIILMGIVCYLQAQQDCISAIPICQDIHVQDTSYRGVGTLNEFGVGQICMVNEQNSVWYKFKTNGSGLFGFRLTPNDLNDDYDWALFNMTGKTCEDLFNDPAALSVSCNAAGGGVCNGITGATNESEYNIQGANCGGLPTLSTGNNPHNAFIEVQEDEIYYLVINNWNFGNQGGGNSGYTLDFGLSEVSIFDEIRPVVVTSVTFNSRCNPTQMFIGFSEPIRCSSVTNDNFQVYAGSTIGGTRLSTELVVDSCDYKQEFTININEDLAFGKYFFWLDVNEDNEAVDFCENPAELYGFEFSNPIVDLVADLGPDIVTCEDEVLLIAGLFEEDYLWSTGDTTKFIEVSEPGRYSVTITSSCGESAVDAINVDFIDDQLEVDLGGNFTLCKGLQTLNAGDNGNGYLWSDGSTDPTLTIDSPGKYWVRVSNNCGTASDTIVVYGPQSLDFTLGNDTTICPNSTVLLSPQVQGDRIWSTGSTESAIFASEPGVYSVTVTDECSSGIAEISIEHAEPLELGIIPPAQLCDRQASWIRTTGNATTFEWSTGSSQKDIEVTKPGKYYLSASNGCGREELVVEVFECDRPDIFIPDSFSPNGDGLNDYWRIFLEKDWNLKEINYQIFDRWGEMIFETNELIGWNGRFKGQEMNAAVFVYKVKLVVERRGVEEELILDGHFNLMR